MKVWLGLDVGSTTTKAVCLDESGRMVAHGVRPTGISGETTAKDLSKELLASLGVVAPIRIVATGYGRARIEEADKAVTEITCHGRGVSFLHPEARTVIDIGGQDSKAIRLAAGGQVEDFAMNDRCAAGTGAFLDVIARRLGMTLDELSAALGDACAEVGPLPVSSTCVVFAESEVVGLLAQGHAPARIAAGIHQAIARRTVTLIRQVKGEPPYYFSGGVARNQAMRAALANELGEPVVCAEHPQLCGALGAALVARALDGLA